MHELSLSAAIADIVTKRADGRRVEVVHLRVGQLRQVVPESLEFCWRMLTEDTSLAGSTLDIERVEAQLCCGRCDATTLIEDEFLLACRACGSVDVTVAAGDEFDVMSLDLEVV